ncbi:gamma-glutamyl-gamma-aminobutyrate hydrolase family protein [Cloacibacillus sp. An23]|uniref:gamma-glutamyl-gamma-aminobutyrate hydrolase family protein n=1 Tax=Cloacibacillus sp. An23 TaxID=1965591 RepID=UPI000B36F08E|nr:gamma-glutamyl-gamma-aminobutyrate hydrolase family protein [Cloacibacillus sp. An23]OUO94300.1 hypothetical protein B5F39_03505 [Cloacibacillus sp. An23]
MNNGHGGRRPLILVTAGLEKNMERNLMQFHLFENYCTAIEENGGVPAIVCGCGEEYLARLADAADGLFLTGGEDIESARYGMEDGGLCGRPDEWRDGAELALCEIFAAARKPILGVCRGLQMINVYFGGTLVRDIEKCLGISHPDPGTHAVEIAEGSWLRCLFPPSFTANSYHHQAAGQPGEGLKASAFSENGRVIEALEHETLPIFAVQWHPERMTGAVRYDEKGPDMAALFRDFCERCAGRSHR